MVRSFSVLVALLVSAVSASASPIEPTFYFGQQYAGIEDSPFAVQHLEDFEDGLFNQPGVTAFSGYDPGGFGLNYVAPPGNDTNSVDGGHDGYAFEPGTSQSNFVKPGTMRSALEFVFDDPPTNAGMAITKIWSPDLARLDFRVYGPTGEEVGRYETPWTSVTVETPFLGASYPDGISAVQLIVWVTGGPSSHFEIDHLQYGVPEPNTLLLGLLAAVGCGALLRPRP
ncbi:MAG: hypothetical protein U0836_06990 [Pirellulales bacterium]